MVQNQVATRISKEYYSRMLKCCADHGVTPYQYLQNLIIGDLDSYSEYLKEGGSPEKTFRIIDESKILHRP